MGKLSLLAEQDSRDHPAEWCWDASGPAVASILEPEVPAGGDGAPTTLATTRRGLVKRAIPIALASGKDEDTPMTQDRYDESLAFAVVAKVLAVTVGNWIGTRRWMPFLSGRFA